MEALVDFALKRRPLVTWVFVSKITDDIILWLDGLRAHDASVDLGRHMQGIGEDELLLCNPRCDQTFRPIRWVAANLHLFGVGES
jgi:hypothetical protein